MEENNTFYLGATVATGFERTAQDECTEKLGPEANACCGRGRIYFQLCRSQLKKALELRSIDHLFVVVKRLKGLDLQQSKDKSLDELCCHLTHSDWEQSVEVWTLFKGLDFTPTVLESFLSSSRTNENTSSIDETSNDKPSDCSSESDTLDSVPIQGTLDVQPAHPSLPENPPYLPTFRVTGHRVGDRHNFSSQEAASKMGEHLIRRYGWPVKMKKFDMEVLVNVNNDDATIGINLTEESLHKRNIIHFGPTTLRSTLAHCMLRLGEPQPGDVICDPMCGGGSIPLEGALNWGSYFLGGDNHDIACVHSRDNLAAMNEKRQSQGSGCLRMDVIQWDVTNLPLRTNSLDVIVSDMPFGKRMGSRLNNWELYRRSLLEMGRVCRQGSGRAVLLTQDKKCMAKILLKVSSVWRKKVQLVINIGGLYACVYVLKRRGKTEEASKQEADFSSQSEHASKQEADPTSKPEDSQEATTAQTS
ncbi:tRNA (guanine(6)-N(2))-methyltransferase THUMP3-like isoform X1 [Asterias amurensis]|uniref:tRNA (guanine(6)-N(2))-methyltransferase THUMP3-like isoform X1 n=1 Tax=Asterias amurensis TaxID=7602 RepID=UPI003AB14CBE